nr:hypothetical protein [Candidatus Cloacimonadota bacterium]
MLYMPTRIFIETGALTKAQKYITLLGKKALIVCGKQSAEKSGVMADLQPLLKANGISFEIYNQIHENPDLESIITGKELFQRHACDFLISIGGGSPMDAAKAISLAAANNLEISQIYDSSLYQKSFPIAAIPTTHGTGSEVTQYSVLTDSSAHKKAGFGSDLIFPRLAIVDPRYMLSLSPRISLNTSLDALSHLLEGIYSIKRNSYLMPMIYRGIRLIIDNLSLCLKEPNHLPAREALATASLFGGITIAHTSSTLQHAIGYPFTTEFGIPHGLANAMFMRQLMDFYAPSIEAELSTLFDSLNMSREKFYAWLESFPIQVKVDLPTDMLEEWIPTILTTRNTKLSPRIPTEAQLREILKTVQK